MSIFKQSVRIFMGSLVAAFLLGGVAGIPAMAQEKAKEATAEKGKVTQTVRAENDKLRAWEIRFRPGDENVSVPSSSFRVVRVLKGGTLLYSFADGKTEKRELKTGDVMLPKPGPQYTAKNVGRSEVVLYVVMVK
jgi:hypothetical protein